MNKENPCRSREKEYCKGTNDLQKQVYRQGLLIELILEIMESWAEAKGLSLISSQQLRSPSPERNQKVRILLKHIRKLG